MSPVIYLSLYMYISRKTLRSLRPEIGEFAGRAGEDRAVEDRAGEDMAGQGRAGGHIKSGQSKSRVGRGQKAGHDGRWALCNMNKQMCRAGPKRRARKKGPK